MRLVNQTVTSREKNQKIRLNKEGPSYGSGWLSLPLPSSGDEYSTPEAVEGKRWSVVQVSDFSEGKKVNGKSSFRRLRMSENLMKTQL